MIRTWYVSQFTGEDYRITKSDPMVSLPFSGPTGSGKTATLYAMLRLLNLKETKLICLEDPVEAAIDGAIQIGINEKMDFTFRKGYALVLRQDS